MTPTTGDPFGTQDLRAVVLDAWTASHARFREDANAEEDLVRGAYRDRLLIELAQNAVDAGAPEPVRLLLRIHDGVLLAANTGRPLTAEGVVGLSTLRASAKRDEAGSIGRFGVGFAAVLAVTEDPLIASTSGAVRWSVKRTRSLVGGIAGLGAELTRRDGGVPALRLPFDVPDSELPADVAELLADGWTTVVRLAARDAEARELLTTLLADLDPALPLVLPGLAEVVIESEGAPPAVWRTTPVDLSGSGAILRTSLNGQHWLGARCAGELPPELLSGLGVEDRTRSAYEVVVWLPLDSEGRRVDLPAGTPRVLRAPQPTDDSVVWPVVVSAPMPLDPGRRRTQPGPLRSWLAHEVGRAVVVLASELVAGGSPIDALALVPTGFPSGEVEAELADAVVGSLRSARWLPAADKEEGALRPADAVRLDVGAASDAVTAALAGVVAGLLAPGLGGAAGALARLGVRTWDAAELVDVLAGAGSSAGRDPSWWRGLYAALADVDDRDAMAALPVPLASGRTHLGVRGVLLPADGVDGEALERAGVDLPVVHAAAAHPALLRWGAVDGSAGAVLRNDQVRSAVEVAADEAEDPFDDDSDPTALAHAVLGLVAASWAGLDEPGLEWLGGLLLPDATGELWPAKELLTPGSRLAEVLRADEVAVVAGSLVERWGAEVLSRVGVHAGFAVVTDTDVPVDAEAASHDLDAEDEWLESLADEAGDGAVVSELLAVRDLDLVSPDRWTEALRLIAADPAARSAVVSPARVRGPHGSMDLRSYAAWWLSTEPVVDGRRPGEVAAPDCDPLVAALLPAAPVGLDAELLRAIGCVSTAAELLDSPRAAAELLDDLGHSEAASREVIRELHGRLVLGSAEWSEPDEWAAPERVWAVIDGTLVAVDPSAAVVVDTPDLYALVCSARAVVPCPLAYAVGLSRLLGVPFASGLAAFEVRSAGVPEVTAAGEQWVRHAPLVVAGADGGECEVSWRLVGDVVHAAGPEGLGRGLAWLAGDWASRHRRVAELQEPGYAGVLGLEADGDDLA